MARIPARFKQSDVMRALKGARAAGFESPRIEIEPNGKIVVLTDCVLPPAPVAEPAAEEANPWDEVIR
jgi:hypothetical protein